MQKLYQTKKRSSRSMWAFWSLFFTFFMAIASALTVSELAMMSNSRVVYASIRSGNIQDLRDFPVEKEVFVDRNIPVFFFEKEHIVIGRGPTLVAPQPDSDVLVVKRKNWMHDLKKEILDHPQTRELFPTGSFGVLYTNQVADALNYKEMTYITFIVEEVNKERDAEFSVVPVPFLLRIQDQKMGLN